MSASTAEVHDAIRRRARELAAQAPDLTDDQKQRLRALLRPVPPKPGRAG